MATPRSVSLSAAPPSVAERGESYYNPMLKEVVEDLLARGVGASQG